MMELVPVVDRYGPAIEWDLRERWQVDIHEYFRGERPWAQLGRFLAPLARSSRYVIAKRNDPEVAMQVAQSLRDAKKDPGRAGSWTPPAEEWDTLAELVASAVDRLGEIEALLADLPIAGKKRKAKPPKRTARPRTAIEDAEKLLSDMHVSEIIADVESSYVSEAEYAALVAEAEAAQEAAQDAVTLTN
jgi:hypothetical protein